MAADGGWQVVFYERADGTSPVREYVDRLSADDAARVTHDLLLLAELGLRLGAPYVRHVAGPIGEFRTRGRVQHRVLYAAVEGRRFVLLHAFAKKAQATPRREIATAEARLRDFLHQERM